MESNKAITFEDLHSVIVETGKDMQAHMEASEKAGETDSVIAIAASIVTLKVLLTRLRQRFEATNVASREFETVFEKIKLQGLE